MIEIHKSRRQTGVTRAPSRTKPWVARVFLRGKSHYIGAYYTYDEAVSAYHAAYKKLLEKPSGPAKSD